MFKGVFRYLGANDFIIEKSFGEEKGVDTLVLNVCLLLDGDKHEENFVLQLDFEPLCPPVPENNFTLFDTLHFANILTSLRLLHIISLSCTHAVL